MSQKLKPNENWKEIKSGQVKMIKSEEERMAGRKQTMRNEKERWKKEMRCDKRWRLNTKI